MTLSFIDVLPDVMEEWRTKSKSRLYADDIEAWAWDILGERYWSKQLEFVHSFQQNRRTAVKSANGTGKSRAVGSLIAHWVTTGEDPGDNMALVTGPALKTVRDVVWQYLNDFYGIAAANKYAFPGTIYSSLQDLTWRVTAVGGNKPATMALGLKPGDGTDIVGAFQGRRGRVKTAVFMDEAGSLHEKLYTAAEAVNTGPESRLIAIGNPDNGRGSEFYRIFTQAEMDKDWKHFSISAFELPTITGEVVYPNHPEKQFALLNGGMPTQDWIDSKERMWGIDSGRWKAKVMGEFPDDDDNVLFSQASIDGGYEADLTDDSNVQPVLGVDLAFGGLDETVVYCNRGGQIRFEKSWAKATPLQNARKVHELALELGAIEVRIDASGAGEGVFSMIDELDEFYPRTYELTGVKGGWASPDPSQWAQARSWHYDQFRRMMLNGEIDLDITDADLKDELISQTFEYNKRNALQVTPKKEMRRNGLPSPDHLDAAIYSVVDVFFEEEPRQTTQTYDSDMVLQDIAQDEFLADYRAYRW